MNFNDHLGDDHVLFQAIFA